MTQQSTPSNSRQDEVDEVGHAMDMLTSLLKHVDDPQLAPELRTAALECWYTSLRLLVEFLTKDLARDISASDFLPGWNYPPSPQRDLLEGEWRFASQNVAHLSRMRVQHDAGQVVNIHPAKLVSLTVFILNAFEGFVNALEAANIPESAQFRSILADGSIAWNQRNAAT